MLQGIILVFYYNFVSLKEVIYLLVLRSLVHMYEMWQMKIESFVAYTDLFNFLGEDKLIFTMDITSLYTVIPNCEGLLALKHFFDLRTVKKPSSETLLRLAELVLTLNCFSFAGSYYKQINGVAMGTKMGLRLGKNLKQDMFSHGNSIILMNATSQGGHESLTKSKSIVYTVIQSVEHVSHVSQLQSNSLFRFNSVVTVISTKFHYASPTTPTTPPPPPQIP